MSSARRELSVVVPTYGREQECQSALRALSSVIDRIGLDAEVIVVEQGERPSYEIPSDFTGTWLFSTVNGASYARNVGLAEATKPGVFFLDDDAELLDGFGQLIDAFHASDAVMVCGAILDSDGGITRGGPESAEVTSTSAFRFFAESSAIWDRERLSAVGGFDERLGPPQPFGAEEGAEVLGRVLTEGGAARFEPVVVVVHPAFDRVDRAKAFRYGRGTGGALWITSSWWMRRYSVMSAIRRVGGVVRCAWRRDGAGVVHRLSWLAGFAVGLLTGWRVRSRPGRTGTDGVIRRV